MCILCVICDDPPGHLQPLGYHMPPLLVEETTKFPDPITFHDDYVYKNSPVIFRGIMKETEVFANWRYDSYLRFDPSLLHCLLSTPYKLLPFHVNAVLGISSSWVIQSLSL